MNASMAFLRKHWRYTIFGVLVLVLFPFVINLLVYLRNPFPTSDVSAWIGFLGNYLGAIIGGGIGGIVTFVSLKLTLDSEKEKYKQEKEDERQKELQRLKKKVWPFEQLLKKATRSLEIAVVETTANARSTMPDSDMIAGCIRRIIKPKFEQIQKSLDNCDDLKSEDWRLFESWRMRVSSSLAIYHLLVRQHANVEDHGTTFNRNEFLQYLQIVIKHMENEIKTLDEDVKSLISI